MHIKGKGRTQKLLKTMLIAVLSGLSALAVVRSLILGMDVDEQYAVTVAYRVARGDMLIKEMWEPHQTSALLPALYIKLFLVLRGNVDYLVLYLRMMGALTQFGVSMFWYVTVKKRYGRTASFLTAFILFHTLPKWIQTPEFANMQIWYLVITFLCLFRYREQKKSGYCIAAGLAMSLEVLAYPTCVFIFPIYFIWLWKMNRKHAMLFGGICVGCAGTFVCYLLAHMSIKELITCISYIFSDGTHSISMAEKFLSYAKEGAGILLYLIAYAVIAGMIMLICGKIFHRKRERAMKIHMFCMLALLIASVDQSIFWLRGTGPAIHPQIRYLLLYIIGAVVFACASGKEREEYRTLMILGWFPSGVAFLAVLMLTNLDIKASMVHLLPGMLCTFLYWFDSVKEDKTEYTDGYKWLTALALFWILTLIGARGWLVRENEGEYSNIFFVKQKALYGSAKGIYCQWLKGTYYNQNFEFLSRNLEPGEKVLYIGDETLVYLMSDMDICTASTISTPIFGENYLAYYEINPQKMPESVLVDKKYWEFYAAKCKAMQAWLKENYDWEEKTEGDVLWLLRKRE